MKVALIEIVGMNDNDKVSATVITEKRRGEMWLRQEAIDVTSGTAGAKRRILLEDDERVVIEPRASEATHRYDPEQKASVAIDTPEVSLKSTPPLKTVSELALQGGSTSAALLPLGGKPIAPSHSGQGAKSTADLKGQK